ncbi:VCBS repeat-containing protein [Streptomyces zhihengii]|uniref:VCBS repeat-containing protein n=1 Tax=Streptomyces zhihengii TaxID=1818004 RepID=UPI0033A35357
MSRATRFRAAAVAVTTGLLSTAALVSPGPAAAEDGPVATGYDSVLPTDSLWFTGVDLTGPTTPRGQLVVALATEPLDGTGRGAGWPASFRMEHHDCREVPGHTAVFTCARDQRAPTFAVSPDTADMTTAYRGYAYVPYGGDLAAGIEAARSAGVRPATATTGMNQVVVKTREHAERNTVAFDLPGVPAGQTVRQRIHVRAEDAGVLLVRLRLAPGEPAWRQEDIRFGGVTAGVGASCALKSSEILDGLFNASCRLEPGDHTISYELTAGPDLPSWRLQTETLYDIYTDGGFDDWYVRDSGDFSVEGEPLHLRHGLLGREASGDLFAYTGTGDGTRPFHGPTAVGGGWAAYDRIARLSPLAESAAVVADPATTRGRGDLVAREGGTLWYHDRSSRYDELYAPRVKVGTGWQIYDRLTGAGDVNGDGHMDLLARDTSGVLWLYTGTGRTDAARFAAWVKVGGGWQTHNLLAGGADLTGDGKADLLARDASGTLWLYRGTGSAIAPFAARVEVGGGWQVFGQLSVAGDLTDDGRPDAVARDASGTLWLYRGAGDATAPFAARTVIGGGWNRYDLVF